MGQPLKSMSPQNYRDCRLAGGRTGTDKEVRAFIEAREAAETAARQRPKVKWINKNPAFRRFDME